MKKTRPSSVSVLPSHHSQFKDKPILGSESNPLGGLGGLAGKLSLRKVIIGAGGLLFVYITITTIFGPTPEHLRRGPSVTRPEPDVYNEVPRDNKLPGGAGLNGGNGNNDRPVIQLPPIGNQKDEPNNNNNVHWGELINNEPAPGTGGAPAGGKGSEKGQVPGADDEGDALPPTDKEANNNKNINDQKEAQEQDDLSAEEGEEETPVSIAAKARKNSPVTYSELLSANKREFDYAVALLVREADQALKSTAVYSVTNKNQTAPSGDLHDYLSLSKYYWPNPNTKNELPYIRKDGHINPEIETVEDYKLMRTMIREVHMMGMAYHFTGDKSYADKCAMRLKEWFLDEETYMNPNIDFGSLQKGQKLGARTGVLDMFTIFRVFDALHYLKQEPSWPKDLIPNLQLWFRRYVNWLETSVLAKTERKGNNNHGTYYDVQLIGIYLFLGRIDDAHAVAESALKNRIDIQITGEGRQTEELARKTSWYYSVFNLQALMSLARWGDDLGVDMWHHEGPQGQSIKKAIDFMLPYALNGGEGWPVPNIKGFPLVDYLKCLKIAWNIYGDEKYLDAIAQISPIIQKDMDEKKTKTISTYLCDMSTLLEGNKRGGQGLIWHWCLT